MLANAQRYTVAAEDAGDEAALQVIAGAGHFEIVAVETAAWAEVRATLLQLSAELG